MIRSIRFFVTDDPEEPRLVRIDTREVVEVVRLGGGPPGWVDAPSLLRIVATDDNLDFDEIDRDEAERVANQLGFVGVLDDAPVG